ncbi:hemerythrin domain-containing protein [Methanobacterium sp. ACI-7]|uniref:hemerythrin domain-containing protein n=1 Tax=unclassified Methanobacterium TaxID=2627676 RepID=UPI0039C4C576
MYIILKNDHKRVNNLINSAVVNEDPSQFREIKSELEIHMTGEEEYFYPKVRAADEDIVKHGIEEHQKAKDILRDLEDIHWDDKEWMSKLKQLDEIVEDHIDEEEKELFPKARKALTMDEEKEISAQLEEHRMNKRLKSIPNEKLVPIPDDIYVPRDIPKSKVRIPSSYASGDVEYEDAEGNPASEKDSTHIRFTGIDKRSDIVVGPTENNGCIRLTLYLDDDNLPAVKEKSTNNRSKILNEQYRPLRPQ